MRVRIGESVGFRGIGTGGGAFLVINGLPGVNAFGGNGDSLRVLSVENPKRRTIDSQLDLAIGSIGSK